MHTLNELWHQYEKECGIFTCLIVTCAKDYICSTLRVFPLPKLKTKFHKCGTQLGKNDYGARFLRLGFCS